jgi:hypothetical protein
MVQPSGASIKILLRQTYDAWAKYEAESNAHGTAPDRSCMRRALWNEFWRRSRTLDIALKIRRDL